MAKVTWIGDPGSAADATAGLGHHVLKKGEAVEVEEENLLEIARGNRYFTIEGEDKPKASEPPPAEPSTRPHPTRSKT